MSDLSRIPQPPTGLEMSATGQTIFTIGVTIPWVVLLVLAMRHLVRDRSPVLLLFLAGGALAAVMEPIVDVLGMCFFPRENQWVGLELFGRPIPLLIWPVYSWFVGGQAYFFWRLFQRGVSRGRLWKLWLAVMAVNVVLETPGLLMGVYTYYGPQPFNLWGLPLWWPPVNATMPIVAGLLVHKMTPHLTGARILAVIPFVPMADGLTNGALAWPVWSALNTQIGFPATYPAAVASSGLAALAIWVITRGLPAEEPVVTPVAAPARVPAPA
jgi:hypothetical protein